MALDSSLLVTLLCLLVCPIPYNIGACHGMSLERIRRECPEEIDKWARDKYRYRFPGGESQQDIASALEPLVMELERQTLPILVVSHSSTMQVLYGYFLGMSTPPSEYYNITIPRNTVIELIPHQYGWQERRYDLSLPAAAQHQQLAVQHGAAGSVPSSPWTATRKVVPPGTKPIFHGTQFYEP
jgi:broad specificity phosphatase PhoE